MSRRIGNSAILVVATTTVTSALVLAQEPGPATRAVRTVDGRVAVEEEVVVVEKGATDRGVVDRARPRPADGGGLRDMLRALVPVPKGEVKAAVRGGLPLPDPDADPLVVQFGQQIRPMIRPELRFVRSASAATPEQAARINKLGTGLYKASVARFSRYRRDQLVGANATPWSDPRSIVQATAVEAARPILTPEQARRLDSEAARRSETRRRTTASNIIVGLDEELLLDSSQRDRLQSLLLSHWNDAWFAMIDNTLAGGGVFVPALPDAEMISILDQAQRRVWKMMAKGHSVDQSGDVWFATVVGEEADSFEFVDEADPNGPVSGAVVIGLGGAVGVSVAPALTPTTVVGRTGLIENFAPQDVFLIQRADAVQFFQFQAAGAEIDFRIAPAAAPASEAPAAPSPR